MKMATAFLMFAVISTQCLAQSPAFKRLDKNNDQKLTRDELSPRLQRGFDQVDTNGDGEITIEEHEAYRARARTAFLPKRTSVKRDLPYVEGGHARQVLDLYLPPKQTEAGQPPALVVFIHGGGWENGNKNNARILVPLMKQGFACASINYRLSGDAIFPAQIHDCKAAIRWLRSKADEFGYDGAQIGVWGSSAGGHLVALLGTSGDVAELEGDLGVTKVSSRVQAVCDYFGPTDFTRFIKKQPSTDPQKPDNPQISKLLGGPLYEHREAAQAASPVTYITADDPPFYIVHGDQDRVVPISQSELLKEALEKAGVTTQYRVVPGAGHGHFRDPEVAESVAEFFVETLNKVYTKIGE